MYEIVTFKVISALFTFLFVFFGMDIRKKNGTRNFVSPTLQLIMKISSFLLIGAFIWTVFLVQEINLIDWIALMLTIFGTIIVTMARRTLGKAHTFTGQCLEKPELVTQGIYKFTRNPLYFGVFLCEIGASLFVLHQLPSIYPQSYQYILVGLTAALLYAVTFNIKMAIREANYLESCFGEAYRQYRSAVPFLIPFFKLGEK